MNRLSTYNYCKARCSFFWSPLLPLSAVPLQSRVCCFNYHIFCRAPIISYFVGSQGDTLCTVEAGWPEFQLPQKVQPGNSFSLLPAPHSTAIPRFSFLKYQPTDWLTRTSKATISCFVVGVMETHRLPLKSIIYQWLHNYNWQFSALETKCFNAVDTTVVFIPVLTL